MAVLSKIRERSMFLIIIIGLALFAFVLDPSTLGDFFNSSKVNEVGEVNGEVISTQEFAEALESYKQQTGGRLTEMQAANAVWENLVRQKVYKAQLDNAGINVGEQDVWNELINTPSVKNNPQFLNEVGFFDEAKFKTFLATTKEDNPELWGAWSNYMNQIKDNTQNNIYNQLVVAGLGASLQEGEITYTMNNTKLSGNFVYVPYTSIADSLVAIKKSEVEAYIKDNASDFETEALRDISYVKFDIVPTIEDEDAIKADVAALIEDSKDRDGKTVLGLKNTNAYKEFLLENGSDLNLDLGYKFNASLNQTVASSILALDKGAVFGPYKDRGYYKISKVVDVAQMPDSVRASHILIPFVGAQRAAGDVTRTKDAAKQLADSLLTVVTRSKSKFGSLAKAFSSDTGSAAKEGDLDWFNYNRMTPAFRDYAFTNKKGAIGLVETPFGYHIIKVDDTRNTQKAVKLATFGKQIVASENTENNIYQKAEQFALEVSKTTDYKSLATENNYQLNPAVGLQILDENVPGLGNQRQIVSWAFKRDTDKGSFKRFDLDNSYVVAILNAKTPKGLLPVDKAINRVRPILLNKKKAALIKDKTNGNTLADIATTNATNVRTFKAISLANTSLSGVGIEPEVVGAMYGAPVNTVITNVAGVRGVFSFKVTEKEAPTALPNYDSNRKKIEENRRRQSFNIYQAIKKSADIEDNRANMYVSN